MTLSVEPKGQVEGAAEELPSGGFCVRRTVVSVRRWDQVSPRRQGDQWEKRDAKSLELVRAFIMVLLLKFFVYWLVPLSSP